ncbi:MAG: GtrA family protein [Ruminococcus sp.]|nr:GtrA family protein [Ruminococcus sp.]
MIKKLWDKFHEIIMYLIFGVLTTVVSWVSYAVFTTFIPTISFWGITIDLTTTSNVLSWICAVVFAYITNKIWVFESKSWKPSVAFKEFWLFVSSRLVTGVIEWVGLPLLIKIGFNQSILGIEGMLAKILVSVIVVILNYVLSKLFIFKNKEKTKTKNTKA